MIIVRYQESFGRMGHLTETFVCEPVELEAMKAVGTYYHGEALGKHSDIVGTMDDETLEVLVQDDDDFIRKAMLLKIIDRNPFASSISEGIRDNGGIEQYDGLVGMGPEKLRVLTDLWGLDDE